MKKFIENKSSLAKKSLNNKEMLSIKGGEEALAFEGDTPKLKIRA